MGLSGLGSGYSSISSPSFYISGGDTGLYGF
jgi:hypothetical protein